MGTKFLLKAWKVACSNTYFSLHLVDGRGFPGSHGVVLEEGAIQIHFQLGTDLLLVETRQRTDSGLQHEHRHHHEDVLLRRTEEEEKKERGERQKKNYDNVRQSFRNYARLQFAFLRAR